MSIYKSTKVVPYVYKLTNRTSNEFYIGFRKANKVPSSEDLGVFYFTSSGTVKESFDQFEICILAEFFDPVSAYEFEQGLIRQHFNDPLCLNKAYSSPHLYVGFGPFSEEHKKNISKGRKKSPICRESSKCNLPKDNNGENNGMFGRVRSKEEKAKMILTRSKRSAEQNLKSFSRQKSLDEKAKLSNIALSRLPIKVCRLDDRKEMDLGNFMRWLKTS